MKNRIVLGLAICIAAGGTLRAQTGIAVKGGAKFSYAVASTSNVTQSIQGQDMEIATATDGTLELAVKKVAADKIDWTYGITKAHLKMSGGAIPKPIDSTIKGSVSPFSTDINGRVTSEPRLSDELQALSSGGFQKNTVTQMFSPLLQRSIKPGESWEQTTADTIDNPAMAGVTMVSKRTIKYTYDGVVDTLKSKLARVRTEVTSMSLEGSGEAQGMKFMIDGDGTMLTTSYYGTDNGILFAAASDGEINARISLTGSMQMVIPMTVKLTSNMLRKGK
jgi:hypothetical protein